MPGFRGFIRRITGSAPVDDLQLRIEMAFRDLLGALSPLTGQVVTGVVFKAATDKIVTHGLGRPYAGFFVVRQKGAAFVEPIEQTQDASLNAQQITLQSANAGTVDLWVY